MSVAIERDVLAELGATAASYLSLIAVTADCLEQAVPGVGGPYRQRILRLRSRLSFDINRETLKDSTATLSAELSDYASVVHRLQTERSVEVERGMLALRDMIETVAQLQESHGHRLREAAAQWERTPSLEEHANSEASATYADSLRNLAEVIRLETSSVLTGMRVEMIALDGRLAGAASTDPVTGLINRGELDRQVAAHKLHGATFSVMVLRLQGPLSDQVMRQGAARLSSQFRHCDRVARWSPTEFCVLFAGPAELSRRRAADAAASLAGRYTLENGEIVEIFADGRILP